MSYPIRFGWCPGCDAPVSSATVFCAQCERKNIRLLSAIAHAARQEQISWDRRSDGAIRLYLLALSLAVVAGVPTLEYGEPGCAWIVASVVLLVGALGRVVEPKTRRPR
ncbi:hypothetical protein [Armatimonas sp.]|uniref:hypothetical protein n=1 Tax=Armatimonas sp. TaxID=1872638 RepID=UPI0037513A3D